jgi:acetoin utilization deacetylase AcuC-like enzyme
LLLVSAGFDAHRDDNMAMLKLTEADYSWVTAELKRVTEKYAQVASFLFWKVVTNCKH